MADEEREEFRWLFSARSTTLPFQQVLKLHPAPPTALCIDTKFWLHSPSNHRRAPASLGIGGEGAALGCDLRCTMDRH